MRFRNAFNLFVDNFKNVYKLTLYKFITGLLTLCLVVALVWPNIKPIIMSSELTSLIDLVKGFFTSLFKYDVDGLDAFSGDISVAWQNFVALLSAKENKLIITGILSFVIALISRILTSIGNFVFGEVINSRMSSYTSVPFYSAFIKNLGKATLYTIIYVPCTLLLMAVAGLLAYLFLMLSIKIGFIGVGIGGVVLILVLGETFVLTLFYNFMTSMVVDKLSVGQALKKCFTQKKEDFWAIFSIYFITCYLLVILNILIYLLTLGSGVIFSLPASYIFLICIQFVNYYTNDKRNYFITMEKIVTYKKTEFKEDFYDDKFDLKF